MTCQLSQQMYTWHDVWCRKSENYTLVIIAFLKVQVPMILKFRKTFKTSKLLTQE